ncbi:SRPBCC family protein [Streptomyces sp. VNUA116]|uniref:SRPBCC family protein n=1 Tax=Streptomyces sp. VNUA116 TaxID=3062449 RepID=UPI0026774E63|nr:SRPBCC family protein [Streptomyces sp. VNUA116]WKU42713.1 SRPBCC family protein [Streptomyces sp. VNUA116]
MADVIDLINAMHRQVRDTETPKGTGRSIIMRRTYDAAVHDVWEACTDPERLGRWFLPVTGELKPGGRYQLEGNAGGEVLRCEPPRLLRVSWIFGEPKEGDLSEVEVRLTPEGEQRTLFELEHTAIVDPAFWDTYGPGATGVGWDLGLVSLSMYLTEGEAFDREATQAWSESEEARSFLVASSEAWGKANTDYGTPAGTVAAMTSATTDFYVPQPSSES